MPLPTIINVSLSLYVGDRKVYSIKGEFDEPVRPEHFRYAVPKWGQEVFRDIRFQKHHREIHHNLTTGEVYLELLCLGVRVYNDPEEPIWVKTKVGHR